MYCGHPTRPAKLQTKPTNDEIQICFRNYKLKNVHSNFSYYTNNGMQRNNLQIEMQRKQILNARALNCSLNRHQMAKSNNYNEICLANFSTICVLDKTLL